VIENCYLSKSYNRKSKILLQKKLLKRQN